MHVLKACLKFPLTTLTDCKIDVNNNNPAGLEHCKLMASVAQYLVKEGKICHSQIQYTVFVIIIIIIIHIYLIRLIFMCFMRQGLYR